MNDLQAVEAVDKRRAAEQFHTAVVQFRKNLRRIAASAHGYEHEGYALERDFDVLLAQAANLARAPYMEHMTRTIEALSLSPILPRPVVNHPDLEEGAQS